MLLASHSAPAFLAGEPAPQRFEFREAHMGTQFRIVLYTADETSAIAASKAAFARIAELDAMMSDYRDDSELMQLCHKAGGPPVQVSEELFFVLSMSQDIAARSDGAFDVTVGPVVRLWRRARRLRQLPDSDRLTRARELVGYKEVLLDRVTRSVQLLKPGMQLDLGGIAKGYAADETIAVLKKRGVSRALVAAAGDIVVSSPPPGEIGWTIGVAPLESTDKPPSHSLLLHDAAVSTSGDLEQFVEIDGKRYSHIIDPKTGMALIGRSSITVIASNGITSDSLATAISVLAPKHGLRLADSTPGAAALLVRATEHGLDSLESSRFKELSRGHLKQ